MRNPLFVRRAYSPPSRRYATSGPPTSSSILLPYLIGGIGGIVAVGAGGMFSTEFLINNLQTHIHHCIVYAYYHFSGAKKVVDKVTAAKERYTDAKAAVVEKAGGAREKLEAMKDAAKVKAAGLRDLWVTRGSRGTGDGVRIQ